MSEVKIKGKAAAEASRVLGNISTEIKNNALSAMARALIDKKDDILSANKIDIDAAVSKNISKSLIDRLTLNDKRIQDMAEGIEIVKNLADPIGEVISGWDRPNGLKIKKTRVPFGVIGIIYESRPNVTVDAAALCLKTGNAVILRGGTDAINSNIILTKILSEAAFGAGIPEGSLQLIEDTDRKAVTEMLRLKQFIDVIIPRGGAGLIKMAVKKATIPVIETGVGNCHVYVESSADLAMAENIVINAKCSRPSVCNAMETLLVDKKIAKQFLPGLFAKLKESGVEIRGDKISKKIDPSIKAASNLDWKTEYLDLILAVKTVSGIDDAISHITKFGSKHSESIVTSNPEMGEKFIKEVDAAAVYVNASTRFTDGYEFGFGAEIGISTQKLHARGPMGLPELTTYKYVIHGTGQVRS